MDSERFGFFPEKSGRISVRAKISFYIYPTKTIFSVLFLSVTQQIVITSSAGTQSTSILIYKEVIQQKNLLKRHFAKKILNKLQELCFLCRNIKQIRQNTQLFYYFSFSKLFLSTIQKIANISLAGTPATSVLINKELYEIIIVVGTISLVKFYFKFAYKPLK